MQIRYKFLTFILSVILLHACHKDSEETNDEILTTFTAQVYQEISSTIVGFVYDENNQPVADATVAIYSRTTKTNKHGIFVFNNAKMDVQGTYIKIMKNGFMLGSDLVYPAEKSTTYSYTKLILLTKDKSFESAVGAELNVNGGGKLIFAPNSISTYDGINYTGKVFVTTRYLNPEDQELGNIMPGGLLADAANGNTVILGTLGMMAVDLRDPNGNKLNIRKGSKAVIEFPATLKNKPEQIGLWSFDENKGRWLEEGVALLQGDVYRAEVTHFSFWNCDAPFPLIEVCGKVLYEDGTPAVNIGVKVEAEGLGTSYGFTNSNGEFCGKMPKGKKLTIRISHYNCNTSITEVVVGPFDNNTRLNDIIIKEIPSFTVKGTIQCSGTPVKEGIVVVKIKEATLIFLAKEDGTFSIDLTNFLCGQNLPVTVFGFDNVSSETSATVSLTNANTQNLMLNVCSSVCDFTAALSFDCTEKIVATVTNGSGNYKYSWEGNPANLNYIVIGQDSLFENKTYCVTITDINAACDKVFCKKIGGKIRAGIEVNCMTGQMNIFAGGGVEPYSFLWSNGSDSKTLVASNPGTYCVTVSDANGCSGTACKDWTGLKIIGNTPESCTNNIYNIPSSPFTQAYYQGNGTNIQGQLTFPIALNVFQTGFNITINAYDGICAFSGQIKLPQLIQGLSTTIKNTSCDTCNDGKINITVNTMAQCYECQVGQVKVFNVNNLNLDLSAVNNAGEMVKGEYYVVVTDANNNCYIAVNKVKIL